MLNNINHGQRELKTKQKGNLKKMGFHDELKTLKVITKRKGQTIPNVQAKEEALANVTTHRLKRLYWMARYQ